MRAKHANNSYKCITRLIVTGTRHCHVAWVWSCINVVHGARTTPHYTPYVEAETTLQKQINAPKGRFKQVGGGLRDQNLQCVSVIFNFFMKLYKALSFLSINTQGEKILLPSARHLEEGRGRTIFELPRLENCISRSCPSPLGSPPPTTPKHSEKHIRRGQNML